MQGKGRWKTGQRFGGGRSAERGSLFQCGRRDCSVLVLVAVSLVLSVQSSRKLIMSVRGVRGGTPPDIGSSVTVIVSR